MVKPSGRERNLKRKQPFRNERPSILIVCEGQKTEPGYFCRLRSALRIASVRVEVEHRGAAPISVVNRAVELKKIRIQEGNPYNSIFCVMDVECPPHESLGRAIVKATDNHLCVILSNPCFEYWYILHFERMGSASTKGKVIQCLKKYYPQYDEDQSGIFGILDPKIDDAIKNAKDILRAQYPNENDLRKCNPSTQVYRVVERMREIAEIQ